MSLSTLNIQAMEIWKDIKGFENLYQVSNHGRVRSLDRSVDNGIQDFQFQRKGKILSGAIDKTTGYRRVSLSNVKVVKFYIHRLVADAFLNKIEGRGIVNHKDECKTNNRVENLEWVNQRENLSHAMKRELPIGVYNYPNDRYVVQLKIKKRVRQYGIFNTLPEAVACYKNALLVNGLSNKYA